MFGKTIIRETKLITKMRNFKEYSRRIIYLINNRSIHSVKTIDSQRRGLALFELENVSNYQKVRKFSISHCLDAMKRKKDGKKKVGTIRVDVHDMQIYFDVEKLISEMENTIENMKNDFKKNLCLRTSVGAIEEIKVNFEDKEYTLQELTQIARKSNMVILNATAFPQALPQIMHAITRCGMNLNPQRDGTKIALPIPKVTREHREILAKNAKALFIRRRDSLKNLQNKQIKELSERPDIDSDTFYRMKEQVELLCEKHVQEAEKILKIKQAELLGAEKI